MQLQISKNALLLELPYRVFENLCETHESINEEFQKYKLKVIRCDKHRFFDYIMILPEKLTKKLHEETKGRMAVSNKLFCLHNLN